MMPNHNTESDADLARDKVDVPVESAAGPAEAPELNTAENETPLADPDGGGAAVDQPDPSETEQASVPGDEPAAAGAEETAPMDKVPAAEADEEELVADRAEPVAVAGAAEDEPPTAEVEEEGAIEDETDPDGVAEEEPAATEPSADDVEEASETADGAAGARAEDREIAADGDEADPAEADEEVPVAAGDDVAPAEVEEGPAAVAPVAAAGAAVDEPPAIDVEDAGAAGDDAAPAEADEEGLAAAPVVAAAAPMAAATAAPAAAAEPPATDMEDAGEVGGEAPPAEADGAALPAAAVGAATVAGAPALAGMATAVEADDASTAAGEGDPGGGAAQDLQDRKRRRLLVGLLALIALLIVAGALFVRYLSSPGPLPDLLPLPVDVNYRPHYLFSIYGIEKPVGVAVSADGERIYVTEISGEREVKVFDRDGSLLHSFSPPYTGRAERAPVYVAVGPTGRVFVADRLQRAVFVYDRDGNMLDVILGPDLTLSEYLSKHVDDFQPGSKLAYNLFGRVVRFQKAGEDEQVLPAPDPAGWAPLGVRVDEQGNMLLTDVVEGQHTVREFPGELILASTWQEFDPPEIVFGAQGHESGEFMYPNSAVSDSKARIYVTDGNNGRISVWDGLGNFLFDFGRGVGESALSLPRGAAMDKRDRLHIVDAVDQSVKVYDVSEPEPRFLFAFGDWGTRDGEFNFPADIALDGTGRLYIADRENNRIQVWSY